MGPLTREELIKLLKEGKKIVEHFYYFDEYDSDTYYTIDGNDMEDFDDSLLSTIWDAKRDNVIEYETLWDGYQAYSREIILKEIL